MLQFPYPPSITLISPQMEKITFLSKVLGNVPLTPTQQTAVFHKQMLKSSLFSARIEGNTLRLADLDQPVTAEDRQKKEVENCVQALSKIAGYSSMSVDTIKQVHTLVMHGLHPQAGTLRAEQSAIFDSYGNIVYLTPDRQTMQQMLDLWVIEAGKQREMQEHIVDCARLHYYFEKIHPFFDGNGRTGRILLQWQLLRSGVCGSWILPIDQYLEEHRSSYYAYLERNTRHLEEFTVFLAEGIVWALEAVLTDIKQAGETVPAPSASASPSLTGLLPRRSEIVAILRDHPYSSLDAVARRFPTIPVRTLSYDIQWLVTQKYVIKHGSTRGARYSAA